MSRRAALTGLTPDLAFRGLPEFAHGNDGPVKPPVVVREISVVSSDGVRGLLRERLLGRVAAVQLMFTTCRSICPIEATTFVRTQEALASCPSNRIQLLSLSIDPATDTPDVPGVVSTDLLLSSDEVFQFEALKRILPDGWMVELQAAPGMAWAAVVYQADTPRSRPMFTVCRWSDRVGLFVQWIDGSASAAVAFTELWPVLELIQSDIFAFTQTYLATVPANDWASTVAAQRPLRAGVWEAVRKAA